ncbi:MAG: thioredoxin family protein [bacterium]|nr:thioredoxin family protein [bacterium]
MEIKILGLGCPKCKLLEDNVRQALAETGLEAEVVKVSDPSAIAAYVMLTPGLAIDGKVRVSGRVAGTGEIKKWIQEVGEA